MASCFRSRHLLVPRLAAARSRGRGKPEVVDDPDLLLLTLRLPARESIPLPIGSAAQTTVFIGKSGAGEGIRTPDPNLGKVVLYP